jgi:hypothetical protein
VTQQSPSQLDSLHRFAIAFNTFVDQRRYLLQQCRLFNLVLQLETMVAIPDGTFAAGYIFFDSALPVHAAPLRDIGISSPSSSNHVWIDVHV